ncbi:MAG: hypothetical protein AAFP26_14670, partial [Planctomycetota bacterium]
IQTRPEHFGPYDLLRDLPSSPIGERFLACHRATGGQHTLYRLPACRDAHERRRLIDAVERVGSLDHPHLTSVEAFSFDVEGHPWLATRFHGHHGGLLTLGELLDSRGGRLSPDEVGRVLDHLLTALAQAHCKDVRQGPIRPNDVLVDRHGSLAIELLGLRSILEQHDPGEAADDVASCLALAQQTLTGRMRDDGVLSASVLGAPALGQFLTGGLDPALGFTSADEAIAALRRALDGAVEPQPRVKSVLRRLRPRAWQRGQA